MGDYNVNNILEPNDAFSRYRENLVDIYKDDYGKSNINKIIKRMNNTTYIFDSRPVYNVRFNRSKLSKNKGISKHINDELDLFNYNIHNKILAKRLLNVLIYKISELCNVSKNQAKKISSLDLSAYSSESLSIINSDNYTDYEKEVILQGQEQYLEECFSLGVNPITDSKTVDSLLEYAKGIKLTKNVFLLTKTRWGKRLTNKVREDFKNITETTLATFMSAEHISKMAMIDNKAILYLPLIERIDASSLDHILFHENRHVIEGEGDKVGINHGEKYRLINEIRTEINAMRDSTKLIDKVLFSNSSEYSYNYYYELFKYVRDFFVKNMNFLNEVSVDNNIDLLEKRFGVNNLLGFEEFLQETFRLLKTIEGDIYLEDRYEKGEQLVKKMNSK